MGACYREAQGGRELKQLWTHHPGYLSLSSLIYPLFLFPVSCLSSRSLVAQVLSRSIARAREYQVMSHLRNRQRRWHPLALAPPPPIYPPCFSSSSPLFRSPLLLKVATIWTLLRNRHDVHPGSTSGVEERKRKRAGEQAGASATYSVWEGGGGCMSSPLSSYL